MYKGSSGGKMTSEGVVSAAEFGRHQIGAVIPRHSSSPLILAWRERRGNERTIGNGVQVGKFLNVLFLADENVIVMRQAQRIERGA